MSASDPTAPVQEALLSELLESFPHVSLTVTGGCMRPALAPGERVRVVSATRLSPRVGDVVLVRHRQGLRLHRLIWRGPGGWRTKGDASVHADPAVPPEHVLGTAVADGRDLRGRWLWATLRSWAGAAAARLRAALVVPGTG